MKKLMLSLSLLSLAVADAQAADTVIDALKEGKASLQLRPRFEWVNDDAGSVDPARAGTVRTVLGYKTAPLQGVTAYLDFEDVHALDAQYNAPVLQPEPTKATVNDPEHSGIHQAWLSGYGVKVGQQKLIFNNARFVGDVDWRQNDQIFTALSYEKAKLLGWLDIQTAYATKARLVSGQLGDLRLPVVNLKAKLPYAGATVTAFWAGLEGQEAKGLTLATANVLNTLGSDKSRQYGLLRVDGKAGQVIYDFSYGRQWHYQEGTNANAPDATYRDIQLGYDFGPVVVKLQQENLTNGFQTPLATLHAFNGWADRFLVTPGGGLVDRNIKFSGKAAGLNLALAMHRFEASASSMHYGNEIDASVSKSITPNLTALLKVAHYEGTGVAPAGNTAYGKDLTKGWVQLDYKF